MTYDPSKVAFIDTETAGLDPERHKVWEIAVIVDGVEFCWQQRLPLSSRDRWDHMVDPWVLENTRIRQDYIYDTAMEPADSIARFVGLVKGRHLVGACPWFDSERLHRLWLSQGGTPRDLPWHYHLIDVENLAVGFMSGHDAAIEPVRYFPEPSLPWESEELSLSLGVVPTDFEPKHSALADARWAKAMFEAIMGGPE